MGKVRLGVVVALAIGLAGCGESRSDAEPTAVLPNGGAGGSAAVPAGAPNEGGSAGEPYVPIDPTGMNVECLRLLGIQGADGKWCAPEAIEIGTPVHIEYSDWSSCVWCYRRVCLATGDGYWLPVEC